MFHYMLFSSQISMVLIMKFPLKFLGLSNFLFYFLIESKHISLKLIPQKPQFPHFRSDFFGQFLVRRLKSHE